MAGEILPGPKPGLGTGAGDSSAQRSDVSCNADKVKLSSRLAIRKSCLQLSPGEWFRIRGNLPEWLMLPGDESCTGSWKRLWCKDHGVVHLQDRCRLPGCLRCNGNWASRGAGRAVHAFKRALAWMDRAGLRRLQGSLWHVVIAPPPGEIPPTPDALRELRKRAYAICREHNITGGAVVGHYAMEEHPGEWRPHVHVVGLVDGRWRPGPTAEGWVIRFLRELGQDLPLWVDLQVVLKYELGHAARLEGRHALTWFGVMGYRVRQEWPDVQEPRPEYELPTCPICGGELEDLPPEVRYRYAGKGHKPGPTGMDPSLLEDETWLARGMEPDDTVTRALLGRSWDDL